MTSHTPGPWSIRTKQNLTAICTPKGEMQLSLHGVYDGLKPLSVSLQEWHANAALIAAAPEMLKALERAINHLIMSEGHFVINGRVGVSTDWREALLQCQVVVTKARGGAK